MAETKTGTTRGKKKPAKKKKAPTPHKDGPKFKYNNGKAYQKLIDGYFDSLIDEDGTREPPLITGLSLWLGFTSRQALLDQENRTDNQEIVDATKSAKTRIEMAHERRMFANNPTGSIFWLKAARNWRDKQEIEHTGPGGSDLFASMANLFGHISEESSEASTKPDKS